MTPKKPPPNTIAATFATAKAAASAVRKTEFPPSQLTRFERPINRQDIDFLKALRSTLPGAFPLVRGCDTESAIRCARLGRSFLEWRRQQ